MKNRDRMKAPRSRSNEPVQFELRDQTPVGSIDQINITDAETGRDMMAEAAFDPGEWSEPVTFGAFEIPKR